MTFLIYYIEKEIIKNLGNLQFKLYISNSPKIIFKETSAPLYPSTCDFGKLYSLRSPSPVVTTVSSSMASTFPAC